MNFISNRNFVCKPVSVKKKQASHFEKRIKLLATGRTNAVAELRFGSRLNVSLQLVPYALIVPNTLA